MHAAQSESYWCVVGSFGFGSIKNCPVKPICFLYATAMCKKLAR